MEIQFGLETEIGINRETDSEIDLVAESIALVRSATEPGVRMCWDYESEDPHADMRGFHVPELRQDKDEANYFAQDAQRQLSFTEIKSDLALGNGARFYNDHAHPEYCTPECSRVAELLAHDRAGERILMRCAQELSKARGETVRLFKNNTDFQGHSYGCHENYLLPRSLPWENLVQGIQCFLITRQIFCGAGKFAVEEEDVFVSSHFQISQRSDFFTELQSVDTMQRRPIINTRDEPHANPQRYRRFHVILGDANMSPFATRLKVGITALVLEALIQNPQAAFPVLESPLEALHSVSRNLSLKDSVKTVNGKRFTALDLQRTYLQAVRERCDLSCPEKEQLVKDWEEVLGDLETDPRRCRDRLDWVAKFLLVEDFRQKENISEQDPWLQSLDLEYHRLDPEEGLYFLLERAGSMRGVPEEAMVCKAVLDPPTSTRAWIRGRCIQKFSDAILSAQWDHITMQTSAGDFRISLLDLFEPADILKYAQAVEMAATPDELCRALRSFNQAATG